MSSRKEDARLLAGTWADLASAAALTMQVMQQAIEEWDV